jgi:hypothetical protein
MSEFTKTIHLIPHSPIVAVPDFLRQISLCPNESSVVLYSYDQSFTVNERSVPFSSPQQVAVALECEENKRVVIHGLNPRSFPYIRHLRRSFTKIRIDWIFWGEMRGIGESQLDPKTQEFKTLTDSRKRNQLLRMFVSQRMEKVLTKLRMTAYTWKFRKYARLLDVMYHWSELDYEAVKSDYGCDSLKFEYFCYLPLEGNRQRDVSILRDLNLEAGCYLIVGHSASLGNNHLDVLPAVARFAAAHGLAIVVPISYGGASEQYKKEILRVADNHPNLVLHTLEKLYSQEQYYGFLIQSAGFIAPGKGSMGAASLFESVANERIPISHSMNPTAQFLKSIGCEVVMYQSYDEIPTALETACNKINHENGRISAEYFSSGTIDAAYTRMLAGEP